MAKQFIILCTVRQDENDLSTCIKDFRNSIFVSLIINPSNLKFYSSYFDTVDKQNALGEPVENVLASENHSLNKSKGLSDLTSM